MLLLQHSGTLVSSSSSCPSACTPSQSAGNRTSIEIASSSPYVERNGLKPVPQGASLGLIRSNLIFPRSSRSSPWSFLFLFFPGSSYGSFCRCALAGRFSSNSRSTRAWQGIRHDFSNGFLRAQLSKHGSGAVSNHTT